MFSIYVKIVLMLFMLKINALIVYVAISKVSSQAVASYYTFETTLQMLI